MNMQVDHTQAQTLASPGAGTQNQGAAPTRFLVPVAVWGEAFVGLYLKVCLPSLLAEGNLPALADRNKCEYVLFTREQDFATISQSPAFRYLSSLMRVDVRILGEADTKDPHIGTSRCYRWAVQVATVRGLSLLFVPPDEIVANGTLRRAQELADSGYKAIFLLTPRLFRDSFAAVLPTAGRAVIEMPPREMTHLAMQHLHPVSKSLFLDSAEYNTGPSHMYWRTGEHSMLARGFHLHPLMVTPEAGAEAFSGTIDDDLVSRFVKDPKRIYVCPDSDEMLMFEMSDASRMTGCHGPNRYDFPTVQNWVRNCTNDLHRRLINTKVLFRSHEKADWKSASEQSDAVVSRIFANKTLLLTIPQLFFHRLTFLRQLPHLQGEVVREDFRARLESISRLGPLDRAFLSFALALIARRPQISLWKQRILRRLPPVVLRRLSRTIPARKRAQQLLAAGNLEGAIGLLTNLSLNYPNHPEILTDRGHALLLYGHFREAAADLAAAHKPPPTIEDMIAQARVLVAERPRQAVVALSYIVEMQPSIVESYLLRAQAYELLGNISAANADRRTINLQELPEPDASLPVHPVANTLPAADAPTALGHPDSFSAAIAAGDIERLLQLAAGQAGGVQNARQQHALRAVALAQLCLKEMAAANMAAWGLGETTSIAALARLQPNDLIERQPSPTLFVYGDDELQIKPSAAPQSSLSVPPAMWPVTHEAWLSTIHVWNALHAALPANPGQMLVVGRRGSTLTSCFIRSAAAIWHPAQAYIAPAEASGGGLNLPSGQPWPMDDGCYDAVVIVGCSQQVRNWEALIAEAKRVLRPGGTLVVEADWFAADHGQSISGRRINHDSMSRLLTAHFATVTSLFTGSAASLLATVVLQAVGRRLRRGGLLRFLLIPARLAWYPVVAGTNLAIYAMSRSYRPRRFYQGTVMTAVKAG
jgi:hypothetical protein